MPDNAVLSEDDKKWKAKSDARSLAEAEVISKDPERLKAAVQAAKELAGEQREEADSMESVAKLMYGDGEG